MSSAPKSKTVQLNLDDYDNQQLVLSWIRDPRCIWVHWGIPCGTSSRARDIKMSRHNHGPPPLRSERFPNGVPSHWLSAKNLARLRAANRLYGFMVLAILDLPETSVWTIEHPWRSWLWKTLYLSKLLFCRKVHFFQFDMCMFGGSALNGQALHRTAPPLANMLLHVTTNMSICFMLFETVPSILQVKLNIPRNSAKCL